jgi:transcription termination/antitermination protein NusG
MHMEDRIYDVQIPMEDVVEIKNGKKVTVKKKVFPGYILVRMRLDDDSWYTVRNTPGVTGFVGAATPRRRSPVARSSGSSVSRRKRRSPSRASSPLSTSTTWSGSSPARSPISTAGSKDIDLDQSKVTVLVNIFGRDTPVELGFEDIQRG